MCRTFLQKSRYSLLVLPDEKLMMEISCESMATSSCCGTNSTNNRTNPWIELKVPTGWMLSEMTQFDEWEFGSAPLKDQRKRRKWTSWLDAVVFHPEPFTPLNALSALFSFLVHSENEEDEHLTSASLSATRFIQVFYALKKTQNRTFIVSPRGSSGENIHGNTSNKYCSSNCVI